MDSADRYAALLAARCGESVLFKTPRSFTEIELQAHWFAGHFGRDFTSTRGERVRVLQFGLWNREAGPDFAEAAVALDAGEPRRGAIEFDPDVRDWERHGHATNPDYESVVLHVFTRAPVGECFTRTAAHRNVPQVLLDLAALGDEQVMPEPLAKPGRCVGPLQLLSEEKIREVLFGAALHRLRKKAAALAHLSEVHGPDEALFQALAATLGYKSNKLPFTLLAQRLSLRQLRAQNADAEALLFGVAGFLPATDLGIFPPETRDYLRGLWERWWAQRAQFGRLVLAPTAWRMSGQRPANHPQRRLAALAQIASAWTKVRALRDAFNPAAAQDSFAKLSHPYWDFHYTVTSQLAPKRMALIGESRVTEMLVNVFFPLAISADPARASQFKKLAAPLTNRRVEIAALRLFSDSPLRAILLRSAAMQQGLLQVYEDFCLRDASDCAECLFPRQLTKW